MFFCIKHETAYESLISDWSSDVCSSDLLINFYLVPGIVLGSIYALGAIGITLVFGVLRFAHLAHGDLATLGAFLVLALVTVLGLDPWLALPLDRKSVV